MLETRPPEVLESALWQVPQAPDAALFHCGAAERWQLVAQVLVSTVKPLKLAPAISTMESPCRDLLTKE